MKKVLFAIICLFCVCGARAANENAATSKEYVDTELATKQPTIPAAGNDIIMTFDSTATDGIGTKNIYDESASYSTQETALVTAATANGAVQMALNGELTCGMYDPDNPTDCWLWNLNSVPERTLPAGYTALPYLESTGTQWLDLGQPIGSGENITVKFEYLANTRGSWFGAEETTNWQGQAFRFTTNTNDNNALMIYATSDTNLEARWYSCKTSLAINTPYILHWYGNPFDAPTLTPNITFVNVRLTESNYLFTPTLNSYLFASHYPPNYASGRAIRIYYFTVEGKMNLIPARRDSDGELGMYDTVSGTFFTNRGTGKFISGVYTEHVK